MNAPHPPENTDAPAITGLGLVTPLGASAWNTFAALLAGKTTADRLDELALAPEDADSTAHALLRRDATTLARATASCAVAAGTATDPACVLAEQAAREALRETPPGEPLDLYLGASKGAVLQLVDVRDERRPRAFADMLASGGPHAMLSEHLARRFPIRHRHSFTAACASSLIALDAARRDVRDGRCARALVVTSEAALHPVFVRSYQRLGVLAPSEPIGSYRGMPLDERREGFTLCECAAAVRIERDAPPGAPRLVGSGVGTQPDDLLRAPADMGTLTRLVRAALPTNAEVSAIHPHATGTPDHDERELQAVARSLDPNARDVPVYAVKGAIGHGLGSAGLVSLVIACLAGRAKRLPPMPWLSQPVAPPPPLAIHPGGTPIGPGLQVICSAGFGGHSAVATIDVPSRAPAGKSGR
ncbi:MAG: beta-ketoacyl synthase N-terminal-like domain-containing protein [Planctomycetota bacterium]